MKSARYLLSKGFTLVELLIVIALIGVLAVAVLAAINPLEQLNRARDTGMESDSSQLLAAIDRYYASREEFPWLTEGSVTSNESPFGFITAQDPGVGVCDTTGCTVAGHLLDQYELKTEFLNRRFIKSTADTDPEKLFVGKDQGASTSVYGCWIPTSQAKRAKATWGIAAGTPTRSPRTCDASTDWTALGTACVICIPQ